MLFPSHRESKNEEKTFALKSNLMIFLLFSVLVSLQWKICCWFSLIVLFLINESFYSCTLLLITLCHFELKVNRIRLNPVRKSIFKQIAWNGLIALKTLFMSKILLFMPLNIFSIYRKPFWHEILNAPLNEVISLLHLKANKVNYFNKLHFHISVWQFIYFYSTIH